jgi:hypothetical protein
MTIEELILNSIFKILIEQIPNSKLQTSLSENKQTELAKFLLKQSMKGLSHFDNFLRIKSDDLL